MARSNIKAVFENDVQTVWNVITDVKNYIWRTDLSKTEIISDKQFIEYTKNGYATTFTITLFEPYKRWEFDVENSNIKGHWIGIFTQKGEKTEIDFTEDVTAKKVLMKPCRKSSFDCLRFISQRKQSSNLDCQRCHKGIRNCRESKRTETLNYF